MRKTRLSEYSNAMHNKTVFINPSFKSCWEIYLIKQKNKFIQIF